MQWDLGRGLGLFGFLTLRLYKVQFLERRNQLPVQAVFMFDEFIAEIHVEELLEIGAELRFFRLFPAC